MRKSTKVLALLGCAVMLVAGSVMGTIAYLSDANEADNAVKNTFTAGKVKISMDESKVTAYGVKDGDNRVAENDYILIPGLTYVKDPTITVNTESEDCYLFVKIENGISNLLISSETNGNKTIDKQLEENGWSKLTGVNGVDNVYFQLWDKETSAATVKVFENFTVISSLEQGNSWNGGTIDVTAYAIQSDMLSTEQLAWNALNP